ncbi:MAG: DEAD/DEAH box helicase [archaeon]
MEYKGFTLDKFQIDAIQAIENNSSVVVSAPTGSGKTLIADYIIERDLRRGTKVIYTAPIKALSNQKYKEFCSQFGTDNVGLLTGDIVENSGAPVLIMTTEIYRNMVLLEDPFVNEVSSVIFDEIHYINDIERGYVWEESIIFSMPHVRFVCLSATIPNAEEFAAWIRSIQKHRVVVIKHTKRAVPLHRWFYDAELGITTLKKIHDMAEIPDYKYIMGQSRRRKPKAEAPSHVDLLREIRGKTPCLFFMFSRLGCQKKAQELFRARMFAVKPQISSIVRERLSEAAPEIGQLDSTRLLRKILPYGIGFHHAGLLPVIKSLIDELFSKGLINVLYATETFAVGINMPAKTVCFESLRKYDGINFRYLNSKEYFQIAGRAGRRGIDKEGYVYSMVDRRDFEYQRLKLITESDTEPLQSQFRLSVNTVLNLIDKHSDSEIQEILKKSFYAYQKYNGNPRGYTSRTFNTMRRKLVHQGFIDDRGLTEKGRFASRIFSDEIITAEIFGTGFWIGLNEYQILLLLACIVYEPREREKFKKMQPTSFSRELRRALMRHPVLSRERRFNLMDKLASMVDPVYHGSSMFDILPSTNLLEGDLIRFFRQMIDRIGQIRKSTQNHDLVEILKNCNDVIVSSMKDIDAI